MDYMLTGHTRYRAGLFRRLVLQVQCMKPTEQPGVFNAVWRDARVEDLRVLENMAVARARDEGAAAVATKH